MQRRIVDFPEPEGPAITIASPRSTSRSIPSRTRLSPKLLRTCSSVTNPFFALEAPDSDTVRLTYPAPRSSSRAGATVIA